MTDPREEHLSILLVEQNARIALEFADHAFLIETGRMMFSGVVQRAERTR